MTTLADLVELLDLARDAVEALVLVALDLA